MTTAAPTPLHWIMRAVGQRPQTSRWVVIDTDIIDVYGELDRRLRVVLTPDGVVRFDNPDDPLNGYQIVWNASSRPEEIPGAVNTIMQALIALNTSRLWRPGQSL